MAYDVVVRGGLVVDGTGAEPYRAELAVAAGRIAALETAGVGELDAALEIDATDRLVLPGFVDAHVHAETVLTRPDVQAAMLRQGVTSVVLGQDGLSFAPGSAAAVDHVGRYFAAVNGAPPDEWVGGLDVAGLLASFDGRTPINTAYLVPLGTVRLEVMGTGAAPPGDQLQRMVRLVEQGLEQGAVGVSTGLEYVPGGFAGIDELVALCEPAARLGVPYVSHLRSYADGTAPGMVEALAIGRRAGLPVHASHYRGRAEPLIAHLDSDPGADVTFDSYPHLYGNTILAMRALPAELQAGGVAGTLARLVDPGVRAELEAGWFARRRADLEPTILGYIASPEYAWAAGSTLAEAAERAGVSLGRFVCDVLVASELVVNCVVPLVGGNSEADIRALARDPRHLACSDGIYLGEHPHPRGWGAFAHALGRYVREYGDWTWGEAARHLAGSAARRFGLAGRGVLARGNVADVVIAEPETVVDLATYEEPRTLARGISDVLVGGELVLSGGSLTGATPGRALRRGEAS